MYNLQLRWNPVRSSLSRSARNPVRALNAVQKQAVRFIPDSKYVSDLEPLSLVRLLTYVHLRELNAFMQLL